MQHSGDQRFGINSIPQDTNAMPQSGYSTNSTHHHIFGHQHHVLLASSSTAAPPRSPPVVAAAAAPAHSSTMPININRSEHQLGSFHSQLLRPSLQHAAASQQTFLMQQQEELSAQQHQQRVSTSTQAARLIYPQTAQFLSRQQAHHAQLNQAQFSTLPASLSFQHHVHLHHHHNHEAAAAAHAGIAAAPASSYHQQLQMSGQQLGLNSSQAAQFLQQLRPQSPSTSPLSGKATGQVLFAQEQQQLQQLKAATAAHQGHPQQLQVTQQAAAAGAFPFPSSLTAVDHIGHHMQGQQQLVAQQHSTDSDEQHTTSGASPAQEIEALLKTRSDMEADFREASSTNTRIVHLWHEVSRKLHQIGFRMSARHCMEKYESIQGENYLYKKDPATREMYRGFADDETVGPAHEIATPSSYASIQAHRINNSNVHDNSGTSGGSLSTRQYNDQQAYVHDDPSSGADLVRLVREPKNQDSAAAMCAAVDQQSSEEGEGDDIDDDDDDVGQEYGDARGEIDEKEKKKRRRSEEEETGGVREGEGIRGIHDNRITGRTSDHASKKKPSTFTLSPSRRFFEKLTRQIMDKQEALHKSFLDTLEKRERERVMRDDDHRRQEMARLNREQHMRAQEIALTAARDAALIAFLQKASGHDLPVSALSPSGVMTKLGLHGANASAAHEDSEHQYNDSDMMDEEANDEMKQNVTDQNNMAVVQLSSGTSELQGNQSNAIVNTRRWPKVEVHALIRLRSGMEPRFREAGPKAHLWQEISASMACMGFSRSPKRCKEKWENINKYFKKTKDSSRKRPENAKTCPYFHQLDTLYQRGILSTSSSCSAPAPASASAPAPLSNVLPHPQHQQSSAEPQHLQLEYHPTTTNTSHANHSTTSNMALISNSSENLAPSSSTSFLATAAIPQDDVNVPLPSKKSMQVEMFVKDILELQQQQHQKLVDEYDRMEQAQELRELAERQFHHPHHHHHHHHNQQQQIQFSSAHQDHIQSSPSPAHHDNAAFMALVHKLAGNSSDLSMSAPPSIH